MGGRTFDDRESLSQAREKIAGLDQRVTSVEQSTQREITLLRGYFDEKFAGQRTDLIDQKKELKDYIDQKFAQLDVTLASVPKAPIAPAPIVPAKLWIAIVIIGSVSAVTFIAFVAWLYLAQSAG